MSLPPSARVALACLLVSLPSAAAAAEQVVLRDGRTVPGAVHVDGQGHLHFTAEGKELSSADFQCVRFPPQPLPFHAAALHQAHLRSNERLTGEILGLDKRALRLRTAWTTELQIPRRALAAVTHFSDAITFYEEDFEKEPSGWQRTGGPGLSEQHCLSGRRSLVLDAPGQEAAFVLREPLVAGRAEINFQAPGPVEGRRWLFMAEFTGVKEPMKLGIAGRARRYAVEAALAAQDTAPVAREPGWHRLSLRVAPEYLIVGVDDVVVWSSAREGPGGPLRSVRLRCEGTREDAKAGRAAVFFDDFLLARTPDDLPRRVADQHQDDVWLLSGDQWFGQVRGADRRSIRLDTRFGTQTLPWGEVRGIYFRPVSKPKVSGGERVRVRFQPGRGTRLDELEGTVVALTEQLLVLRHAALGDLEIDRGRLRELQPLPAGGP